MRASRCAEQFSEKYSDAGHEVSSPGPSRSAGETRASCCWSGVQEMEKRPRGNRVCVSKKSPRGSASRWDIRAGHPSDRNAMTKGWLEGTGACLTSHEGEVYPCGCLPVIAGELRKQTLVGIWGNRTVLPRLATPAI